MKAVYTGFQKINGKYLPTEIHFFDEPGPGEFVGQLVAVSKMEVLEK
jgi:hypothetical protein